MFETSRAFTQMFRQIGVTNHRVLHSFTPKRCTISTMTIQGTLNKGIPVETIKSHGNLMRQNGLRIQTNSKDFNNQVTVKSGNASIKIFTNGRVHCTGSQSLVFFIECMDRLCRTLNKEHEALRPGTVNTSVG